MYIYTIETNKQLYIMENLLLYLLVCLAVIFLLASLETLTKDFKYIAKDIMQAIKPGKISMNDISGKPNQKKQPNQSINQ